MGEKCKFSDCDHEVLHYVLQDIDYASLADIQYSQLCDEKFEREDLILRCIGEGHFNGFIKCTHNKKLKVRVTKTENSVYYKKKYYACAVYNFPHVEACKNIWFSQEKGRFLDVNFLKLLRTK
jgi:hypothetical protein